MNWPTTRLRYVADLNPGIRADLLQAPDVEVSFLPMDAIGEDGTLDLSRNRAVAEVRNGYSYFEEGDVAFAKVTPCFENGKGALMRGLEFGAGFGTTEITVLRPKEGTEPRFLNYVLRSEQFRQNGVGAMTGAGGLKRVPDDFTRDFKTPWPTPDEQERIANFLDEQTARIDALIAEKERLDGRLQEYRLSLISAAVTGQIDGENNDEAGVTQSWPTRRLRYVAELNPAVRSDLVAAQDTEVTFLPMDAIGEDGSLNLERVRPVAEVRNGYSYFEDGDVAFAKVTPCFENGKGALMRNLQFGAGFGTTELTVLRPKVGTCASFLRYVLQSENFRRNGAGAMTGAGGLKRVPDDFTRDFETPWPPHSEQERIAAFLDEQTNSIDALRHHVREHIERLREYRSSLISAAVTGQLDLSTFKAVA